MKRALLAVSTDTPDELLAPVEAALALELEVARVDLGRVSTASGAGALERLDRLVKAVVTLGEGGERRLQRELQAFGPDVAIALDPGAAAALVRERDRAARAVPVIAVVTELAPRPAWAVDADRYVAVDDEAAVALADHGVDGARVHVVGALPRHAWGRAGRADRAALRAKFKLPAGEPVALVFAARLGAETLAQVALQLSLLKKSPYVLFDAGDDTDAAAQLRRQVPPLGLKAKLFGQIADAPELWRAADVVLARPRPRAVHETLACGCAFVALEPQGDREAAEARALEERGIGRTAARTLLIAAALEPLFTGALAHAVAAAEARRGDGGRDGAETLAQIARDVAERREDVLAETRASAAARDAAQTADRAAAAEQRARQAAPPGELEDLGGDDLDLGDAPGGPGATMSGAAAQVAQRLAQVAAEEARLRRELSDVRADAERWEQRRALATQKGQKALAADAGREAERKRARMHAVLEELSRLHAERERLAGAAPPPAASSSGARPTLDDELAEMKRADARKGATVDDELAALKRRMKMGEKKP